MARRRDEYKLLVERRHAHEACVLDRATDERAFELPLDDIGNQRCGQTGSQWLSAGLVCVSLRAFVAARPIARLAQRRAIQQRWNVQCARLLIRPMRRSIRPCPAPE